MQLNRTVTLVFWNRKKLQVTDIQMSEINELVQSLTSGLHVRLVRKFEVIENGSVRKVEVVLGQE